MQRVSTRSIESFEEWRERTRLTGFYKMGFSVAATFIGMLVHILLDPTDPDLGLATIATVLFVAGAVLWFLGFWDYVRSKGLTGGTVFLSVLYLPGLAIAMAMRESWDAFGPSSVVLPSIKEPSRKDLPKVRRFNW